MNMSISESSSKLTLQQVIQERSQTIKKLLKNDIPKIGSGLYKRINSPIKDARKYKIKFKSNIDNSGSAETVIWKFTDNKIEESGNPDDQLLLRKVDDKKFSYEAGVTHFEFTYLDKNHNPIDISLISKAESGTQSERDKIRYIKIKFTIESEELVGGAGPGEPEYLQTNWKRQFTPVNLAI